jgi:hypothetical protein
MKETELRIGNWVWHEVILDYYEVGRLDIEINYSHEFSELEITEEWLLKFGFEKTDDYGDIVYYAPRNHGNRHYYVCFDHDDISFGLSVFNNCTSLIYDNKWLQYVHQLQNLYFALTGEELVLSN